MDSVCVCNYVYLLYSSRQLTGYSRLRNALRHHADGRMGKAVDMKSMMNRVSVCFIALCMLLGPTTGCVGMKQYNIKQDEYIRVTRDAETGAEADLCIIEFDDEGEFWDERQLTDTLQLIARRNAESPKGIVVPVYIHG